MSKIILEFTPSQLMSQHECSRQKNSLAGFSCNIFNAHPLTKHRYQKNTVNYVLFSSPDKLLESNLLDEQWQLQR